ncbi:MAG: WYL domain-containing protein [Myxococcales bacterium]|nr:WYL domain-containing protein [Myxococcales bacterium]
MTHRREPLDHRLAAREPRTDPTRGEPLVRARSSVRIDRPEDVAAVMVGLFVLEKAANFGQARVNPRTLDELRARLTADLSAEEVMNVEVEAYAITDWLVGGAPTDGDDDERVARRDGDVILYDPSAAPVELIRRALDESFELQIDYFSRRRGEMNTRRVRPIALEAETYLRAWCHARRDERVFRLNRITRCVPITGRPFERPTPAVSSSSEIGPRQISLLDDD